VKAAKQQQHKTNPPFNFLQNASDSLGGNAQTTILATISPDARDLDESMSTLRYAERAKQIVNKVSVTFSSKPNFLTQ